MKHVRREKEGEEPKGDEDREKGNGAIKISP